ncbi:Glutamate receptor ionotropic, kainate 2 [Armadillidium vulgare]|nr:Glutamate receptor ionotropic, kainate 2 [Armadillidium vulgare]
MLRSKTNLTGNSRYEGFCVDLLESISEMVGFDYEINISGDGLYGVIDMETQEWNGLVKELIDKVPTSQPTRLFSFMNPLAVEIWLYVLAAYVLVSFTMFVMARFSPFEWSNPHPCNTEADVVENQFSLNNSFWFITGTLLRQGSGLNPKVPERIPTRLFSFMSPLAIDIWLYILAAYVVVSLTIYIVARFSPYEWQIPHPCKPSIDEIKLNDFTLGNSFWFTIGTLMQQGSDLNPKVLEGDYAFLMESTMLDYNVQRNCNLTQIGGLLNSNSYGIATPIGSPWRDKISLAILELQEKGVIQMLYSKWWRNTGDVCNRDEKNKDSKANALGVENIVCIFVLKRNIFSFILT